MSCIAVIEIPKNSDRRIHKPTQGSEEFVDFGPIKDLIPLNEGRSPVAYGFIEGTVGDDGEGDEVDVLVFSKKEFVTGDKLEVNPFGIILREDKDHKVIATDSTLNYKSWNDVPDSERKLIKEFIGYKSKIVEIKDGDFAAEYLDRSVFPA